MRSNLFKRGFVALLVTQFFGAANDNLLKGVLTFGVAAAGFWAAAMGEGGQAIIFWCLTLPFIFLSGYAGQIADRISKQRMTLIVKVAEVAVGLVALIGFVTLNLWVCVGALILFAIQSAFFGPAKYGMIPELVRERELSRANGSINMFTNIAVIVGMLIAGPVYEWWRDAAVQAQEAGSIMTATSIPGLVMIGVAVLGLAAARFIPPLEARAPMLRFDPNPAGTYLISLREMHRKPILWVALAWSFFYLVGSIALLILPDYPTLLDVSETDVAMLMGLLGVSLGIGSIAAGLLSGNRIEPRLIPVGAAAMSVCFVLLGIVPRTYWMVAILLFAAGVSAGFYIIPLQSLLQFLSPPDERGRFLGTANGMSFVFSSIGALLFLLARRVLGLDADRIFLICAVLSLVGTGLLIFRMWHLIADPELRARSEGFEPVTVPPSPPPMPEPGSPECEQG